MYATENKTINTAGQGTNNARAKTAFFQPKLTINTPGDQYEQEADQMADTVMRMPIGDHPFFKPSPISISRLQRKCKDCEDEEKMQRKEYSYQPAKASNEVSSYVSSLSSKGSPLPDNARSFFEPRFGQDFSGVRIHNDTDAAKSSQAVNALAYTVGSNIVFNQNQFSPESDDGKKLLAHELTHVVQQSSVQRRTDNISLQRKVYHGTDHAGTYDIDTDACTLNYGQDWYFNFKNGFIESRQNSYMASAERQVEGVWSHKYPVKPDGASCPCHDNGFDVTVALNTKAESRNGRHGYSVEVNDEGSTGLTNQPKRQVTLDTTHETPVDMGSGLTQQRVAHEFGHTLGITDEYNWWAALWRSFGHDDRSSIMNFGDEVRPRHYQQFADIINMEMPQCTYRPQGFSSSSLANPVAKFGITASRLMKDPAFVIGLHLDRRIGNDAVLGLFYPQLGFDAYLNTKTGAVLSGPTAGLSLNRIAHPLFLEINTGVLFDPGKPGNPPQLNIPASVGIGLRGNGFQAGVNYTGMFDVLNGGSYTQIVGVSLSFDLP